MNTEEFISLPHGKTFIRWDSVGGNTNNDGVVSSSSTLPILLMIHGGTVPSWQFDGVLPELLNNDELKGYRILRLDLYGHGQSAGPGDVKYNLDLFVTQVLASDGCY